MNILIRLEYIHVTPDYIMPAITIRNMYKKFSYTYIHTKFKYQTKVGTAAAWSVIRNLFIILLSHLPTSPPPHLPTSVILLHVDTTASSAPSKYGYFRSISSLHRVDFPELTTEPPPVISTARTATLALDTLLPRKTFSATEPFISLSGHTWTSWNIRWGSLERGKVIII